MIGIDLVVDQVPVDIKDDMAMVIGVPRLADDDIGLWLSVGHTGVYLHRGVWGLALNWITHSSPPSNLGFQDVDHLCRQ